MELLWIILASFSIGIIAAEWMLWELFNHRAEGLHLHLSSTTGRRVFTIMRIRMCVVLHSIILFCMTAFSLLFLW